MASANTDRNQEFPDRGLLTIATRTVDKDIFPEAAKLRC